MFQAIVRNSNRTTTPLTATVKFKGNKNENWKETTQTISISRNGAGFFLHHECHIGRLLSIILPLPKYLRCYDREKEFYRIWGLIQHCNEVIREDGTLYHVGVAFVGKDAPAGYKENPASSYKICGMSKDGLWHITQTAKPFVARKYPRFWTSLDVWLELIEAKEDNDFTREKTLTENISASGVSVFSSLDIEVDECLNFTSKAHDFSALAVVRHKTAGEQEQPKLHLEFVNAKFPIEKLVLPVEEETEKIAGS